MSARPWRQFDGSPIPDDMVFSSEPPDVIGEVLAAWTSNTPQGPPPVPLWIRATWVGLGALAGMVVGLVGFFVVGGILEEVYHTRVEADDFLRAMMGGTGIGTAFGCLSLLRKPGALSYFVGTHGCAQIERRPGKDGRVELLDFRDVRAIRTRISDITSSGIRTVVREFHVTRLDGRERMWFLSGPPGVVPNPDPQIAFGDAVLGAFAAFDRQRGS